jgi:hypothetical protein
MSRNWQTLLGLAAGVLVAGYSVSSLVGCASNAPTTSSRPGAAQLKEGLNVLEMKDPSIGLSAAYMQNGRVVYIETRTGSLKPEVYRNDSPEAPANEIDTRIVDHNDYTFYSMRGGDNFAEPSWAADIARSYAPTAPDTNRELDMAIARQAVTELIQAAPATFKDHVFHLNAFLDKANPMTDPALVHNQVAIEGRHATPEQKAYGTYANGAWTEVYGEKWSMPLVELTWFYAASHSATEMYAYYSGAPGNTWVAEFGACNHGNCPGGSHMSADCYSWNSASNVYAGGITVSGATTSSLTGANDGNGGCQTAYNWDSGSGQHLCNDDAAYELYQTVHGTTNQANFAITNQSSHCRGSTCGQSPSNFACNCAGGACSGDWNTPNCGGNNL